MGSLENRMKPELILLDVEAPDKTTAVQMLVEAVAKSEGLQDPQTLFKSVMDREAMASTCLGSGCAVPHAHSPELTKTVISAARLTPPAAFDSPDDEPVALVFLMAGPENGASLHLKLLSRLARLLSSPDFRQELQKAGSPADFLSVIAKREE